MTAVPQVKPAVAGAEAPTGTRGAGDAAAKGAGLNSSRVPTAAAAVIRPHVVVLRMSEVTAPSRNHWTRWAN
uniref:Uncharacterized protein n=1 Tax=Streptomyces caniferus TaxID=285557 RepID=A0A493R1C0_9ACTN|nr:hypothetical protein [Streptomyces caniferus]